MKQLKLRAWDNILNEMIYSKVEQFDDSLLFRFDKHFETENPIYMQYTGLKDKNGKEIYEGDIIFIPYNRFGNKVVTFENGKYNICDFKYSVCEVIGNIYENPLEVTP